MTSNSLGNYGTTWPAVRAVGNPDSEPARGESLIPRHLRIRFRRQVAVLENREAGRVPGWRSVRISTWQALGYRRPTCGAGGAFH
jgi:hypothetical protein